MLKALFISLNVVGLAMLPFLYVGNISVEHQAPSEVAAGETVEVTITLNKGTITGPARLKLDFSDADGLVPESIENGGSSFSYADGSGLFIWYSIQPDEVVTLKYSVTADAAASGTKTISGSFSYLDEEERKKMDIPSVIIEVAGGAVASSPTTENNTSTEESTATSVADEVSGNRTIEKDGDNFLVTVNIIKGSNSGFARVKEAVPAGFNAEAVENAGAVFKFVDNSAKFLWTSLPASKDVITIKYRLIPSSASGGEYEVNGEFSGEFLVVDDKPESIIIPTSYFNLEGDFVADNNNGNNNNNNNNNNSDNGNNNSNQSDNSDNNTSTSVPSGNGDVSYKVQVMAAHRTVSSSYMKKHYGFSGKISIENHEGWVKYTTGSFGVYKEARDKRNSLSSYNFPGPFVTAYNKGERITVQEALMITKQEWVQ